MRRIALVAGGTAGHVYPALALAYAYRQAVNGLEVIFFGTHRGFESQIVPQYGYPFQTIQAAPAMRVSFRGKLLALKRLFTEAIAARRLLKAANVQLVIGFGGFATPCVLLAARSLGLRTAIYEANVLPGRANRLAGYFVDRIYLNFEMTIRQFAHKQRIRLTGYPLRPEIISGGSDHYPPTSTADRPCRILVTGGSEGSPFLNQNVPDLIRQLAAQGLNVQVRHQTGDQAVQAVRDRYAQLGITGSVAAYFSDMAEAYRWADFAIACAGTGTLAELAYCGIPALIVPLATAADDHQLLNARKFAEISGALWIRESDWQISTLAPAIIPLVTQPDLWLAASRRMRDAQQAMPLDAASKIIADCEALMHDRWYQAIGR